MSILPVLCDDTPLQFAGVGMRAAKYIRGGFAHNLTGITISGYPWCWAETHQRLPVAAIMGWFDENIYPVLLRDKQGMTTSHEDKIDVFYWWVTHPRLITVKDWDFQEWGTVAREMMEALHEF